MATSVHIWHSRRIMWPFSPPRKETVVNYYLCFAAQRSRENHLITRGTCQIEWKENKIFTFRLSHRHTCFVASYLLSLLSGMTTNYLHQTFQLGVLLFLEVFKKNVSRSENLCSNIRRACFLHLCRMLQHLFELLSGKLRCFNLNFKSMLTLLQS